MFLKRNPLTSLVRFKHVWVKPHGKDTGIKMFNCVTRDKQPLILNNWGHVTWYTCGPTVYDSSHIGHASCYIKLDIVQRILHNFFNLNVITAMNITDIDDKIIAKSVSERLPIKEIASRYEQEFWTDLNALGIPKPHYILRVSENIELIQSFIERLIETGHAYKTKDGSVYFDVSTLENYGKLQNISEEEVVEVGESNKKSTKDFALWKAASKEFWKSPWGPGRPGWHIECSAIATSAFGSNIDIHAGGIDLRFPHHENEEAQSCAFHSTNQWVNYWIHTGHLHQKGAEKMSKSLKNTITIQQLLRTVKPEDFRMACVMSHYRSKMEYSSEFMSTARNVLENYKNFVTTCNEYKNGYIKAGVDEAVATNVLSKAKEDVYKALCDDFDTPAVVNVLNEVVQTFNGMLHSSSGSYERPKVCVSAASNLIQDALTLFGIGFGSVEEQGSDLVEVLNILNGFRQDIRQLGIATKDKDLLKLCDGVRDDLKKVGISIKDHGKLSSWSL